MVITVANLPAGTAAGKADSTARPAGRSRLATGLRLLVLASMVLVLLAPYIGGLPSWLDDDAANRPGLLLGACLLYAGLLVLPFIPSVEIGLLIMLVFGKWGVLGAWLATVAGLNVAYGIARYLSRDGVARPPQVPESLRAGLERIARRLPAGSVPVAGLAVLLNMPGNTVVGGGGGIALLYGAGRVLSWPRFALTVAVATSAVPLLFLFGIA